MLGCREGVGAQLVESVVYAEGFLIFAGVLIELALNVEQALVGGGCLKSLRQKLLKVLAAAAIDTYLHGNK